MTGRMLLVGLVAGVVLGTGVGVRALVDDAAGLWFFGLLFGAVIGGAVGLVTAGASAAVIVPRVSTRRAEEPVSTAPVSLWWHLLVPVPAATAAAWWALQSPLVPVTSRLLVTAAVATASTAWLWWTAGWVVAPAVRSGAGAGR